MPSLKSAQGEIKGFMGVNLRQERLDLEDYDLAKAINADLHSMIGTITLRSGRTKQFDTALTDLEIRRLGRVRDRRYQVAGQSLYRNQVNISTALSSNMITTMAPYRPLSDATIWEYIADDAIMLKDDGYNLRNWSIAAPGPSTTPSASPTGSGSLSGVYSVKYTYVRKSGTTLAAESNPSPASANSNSLSSETLSVAGLVPSTDPQVNYIRIYRTTAGGSTYLYDQEIPNGQTTAISSQADSALGAEVETDHYTPPTANWITFHQDCAFLCGDDDNPDFLYYSKRFEPEYFPPLQYLELGDANDPLVCSVSHAGMLGVFSLNTKYRVLGNILSGFVGVEAISHRGTCTGSSVLSTEYGIVFLAKDGIYVSNLSSADSSISEAIAPLFYSEEVNDMQPINWDFCHTISSEYYKGRYYIAYPSGSNQSPDMVGVYSLETKKWYFYQYPVRSMLHEETTDLLLGGGTDGFVYALENGSTDGGNNIQLTVQTKDYYSGSSNVMKMHQFFKVDAECFDDFLYAEFFVDGTSFGTYIISGSRTRILNVLPPSCMGFSHRIEFTFLGNKKIKIYGIEVISVPLR